MSWLISFGTDTFLVSDGSLSMIIPVEVVRRGVIVREVIHTLVGVLDTLLDRISRLAKDCFPYVGMNGHINAGRKRISRLGAFEDSVRHTMSVPTLSLAQPLWHTPSFQISNR